ncbi:MAG TPA: hypothetical protein VF841_03550 [Anaeromyxobacter sp.]
MTRASLAPTIAVLALAACSPKSPDRTCPSGQERCNGTCVDPASYAADALNCGACGVSCGPGTTCAAGTCQCGSLTLCPASNPRCTDLTTDRLNCGACGSACTRANDSCSGGTCQCLAPYTDCGAVCANTRTDPSNCGACGYACPLANEECVAQVCRCPSGATACATACAYLTTDEANCGACGRACPTGETCTSGVCCPSGELACGGACVSVRTDPSNCGACGTACASGASCASGICTCPAAEPAVCGTTAGSGGTCCAGNGCCTPAGGGPSTCQISHSNGVGQSFYDCVPAGTYDVTQAQKAAQAWDPGGMPVAGYTLGCASQSCLGWQTAHACGVWCYGGDILQGRAEAVQSLVCPCPTPGSPSWN